MAVKLIQKDKRPEVAPENKKDEVIVLSEAQHDPHLAKDFRILKSEEAAISDEMLDGQSDSPLVEDRGKSAFRKRR